MTKTGDKFWTLPQCLIWMHSHDPDKAAVLGNPFDMHECDSLIRKWNRPKYRRARAPSASKLERRQRDPSYEDQILTKVHQGLIKMIGIRTGQNAGYERVYPDQLPDVRIVWPPSFSGEGGDDGAPYGLLSHGTVIWKAMKFLKGDVTRELNWRLTTEESEAKCRELLLERSLPENPLSEEAAWKLCQTEIPGCARTGFRQAFRKLPPMHKKRRGQHGPRRH